MMKNKQDLSRRDFIRNSVMAGGAVLLSGVLPSHAQTPIFSAAENSDSPLYNDFAGHEERRSYLRSRT